MKTETMEAPTCGCCRRVPLSYLALDLDEPLEGWVAYFAARNIEVASDHLGRPSIGRHILQRLLDEQRDREARVAQEAAERAARAAVPVAVGVPAIEGGSAYEALMSAGAVSPAEEFGGRPKPNFLVQELEAGQRHRLAEQEAIRQRKGET